MSGLSQRSNVHRVACGLVDQKGDIKAIAIVSRQAFQSRYTLHFETNERLLRAFMVLQTGLPKTKWDTAAETTGVARRRSGDNKA
jgi:hypothetical protein